MKHINIFMKGHLNDVDFNFYSQTGAYKYNIQAVYKNGDSIHVDIEAEGKEDDLNSYIEYLKEGPLKKHIYLFRAEESEFVGIDGFKSLKIHKENKSIFKKLKNILSVF